MAAANQINECKTSWAVRHLSIQPSPVLAPLLAPEEVQYVERSSGRYIHENYDKGGVNDDDGNHYGGNDDSYAPAAVTCLMHLRALVDGNWRAEWDGLMARDYAAKIPDDDSSKAIRLGLEVAAVLRNHGNLSLYRLIQKLQDADILRMDANHGYDNANGSNEVALHDDPMAHSLVFSVLGWLSLLYIPAPAPAAVPAPGGSAYEPVLRIVLRGRSTLRSHVDAKLARRPLEELLRSFGDLLPKRTRRRYDDQGHTPPNMDLQFEVAQLNVAALQDMAGIQIVWVDDLSGHLVFDAAGPTPTLRLFKCPSFCKLHRSDATLLNTMLAQFYEDDEQPSHDFSAAKLVGEIILSYNLLFRANSRSQRIYEKKERARAAFTFSSRQRQTDPYLDELCGYPRPILVRPGGLFRSGGTPSRISYDAAADFPIFQDRLRRIQDHMKSVQPTGFRALWRDRRDLRLWYTIWVFLILTVADLIVAIVSMVLAGVQVNLAKQAIDMQLQQNVQGGGT